MIIIFCKCLMGTYGSDRGLHIVEKRNGREGGMSNRAAHRFREVGVMS